MILTHGPRDHALLDRWFTVTADGHVADYVALVDVPRPSRGDFVHWSLLDEDTRSLIWWAKAAPGRAKVAAQSR